MTIKLRKLLTASVSLFIVIFMICIETSGQKREGNIVLDGYFTTVGSPQQFLVGQGGAEGNRFSVMVNGNVGIGINPPQYKLHVIGEVAAQAVYVIDAAGTKAVTINPGSTGNYGYLNTSDNIKYTIGSITPDKISAANKEKYNVFVKKGILSEDYAVLPSANWADYVFENRYRLRPLHELESFIQTNKHLPGIPSQAEIAKEGYSLPAMNVKFLEKIEELTLYTIEQDKRLNVQEQKIKTLEEQIKILQQSMNDLRASLK